jgi:TrmH family RNA methyltransferase
MYISSLQNTKIKEIKKLEKSAYRKETGTFLLEGLREINLANRAGYFFESIYVCESRIRETQHYNLDFIHKMKESVAVFTVSEEVYSSVAYRESTEGIFAVTRVKQHTLSSLQLSENPLILVIEGVEKPGNFGAMLRTCDAVNADAVIICDAKTDVYNANVIRSSVGTVFTNQIAVDSTWNVIQYLKEQNINSYAAYLETNQDYYASNFVQPTAIVVGTEADGLSEEWINAASYRIKIPMLGEIDSLNVSVSAAILLYEGLRQRIGKQTI